MKIKVFNLSGQLVYNRIMERAEPGQLVPLRLDIPSGIYILLVESEDRTEHKKLVVE